eukprot:403335214
MQQSSKKLLQKQSSERIIKNNQQSRPQSTTSSRNNSMTPKSSQQANANKIAQQKKSFFANKQKYDNFFGDQDNSKMENKFELIKGILNKPSNLRNDHDLEKLVPLIKTIEFFYQRDIKDADFPDIVQCLTYEHIEKGNDVFEYNSMGDKFYIILKGTVSVWIPNPDNKDFKKKFEDFQKHRQIVKIGQQVISGSNDIDNNSLALTQQSINLLSPPRLTKKNQSMMNTVSQLNQTFTSSNGPVPGQSGISPIKNSMMITQNRINLMMANNPQNQQASNNIFNLQVNQTLKVADLKSSKQGFQRRLQAKGAKTQFNLPRELDIENDEGYQSNEDQEENAESGSIQNTNRNSDYKSSTPQQKPENKSSFQSLVQKITFTKRQVRESQNYLRRSTKANEQPLFIEFLQLKTGKSFGELALIKNKPRAATIRCVEDCHFAVMSQSDYMKILNKIEQKNMSRIVEFMHELPFFKVWTRTSLGKLQYSFEQKQLQRNQVLYREGQDAEMIYIIQNGEFEVTKRFKKEQVKEVDISKLLSQKKDQQKQDQPGYIEGSQEELNQNLGKQKSKDKQFKSGYNTQIQLASRQRNVETFKIAILGPGQMFGEDDVIHERQYTSTIICRSNVGQVFAMKAQEFFRKLKPNEECWRVILGQVQLKDHQMKNRMSKIDYVFHKEIQKPLPDKNIKTLSSEQNQTRQQKYPSILAKYQIKPTQKKLEDFRETLKEIVDQKNVSQDQITIGNTTSISPNVKYTGSLMKDRQNIRDQSDQQRSLSPAQLYNDINMSQMYKSRAQERNLSYGQKDYENKVNLLQSASSVRPGTQNFQGRGLKLPYQSFHTDNMLSQRSQQDQFNRIENNNDMIDPYKNIDQKNNFSFSNSMMANLEQSPHTKHLSVSKDLSFDVSLSKTLQSNNNPQQLPMNHFLLSKNQTAYQNRVNATFTQTEKPSARYQTFQNKMIFCQNQTQKMFSTTYENQKSYMSVAHTLKPSTVHGQRRRNIKSLVVQQQQQTLPFNTNKNQMKTQTQIMQNASKQSSIILNNRGTSLNELQNFRVQTAMQNQYMTQGRSASNSINILQQTYQKVGDFQNKLNQTFDLGRVNSQVSKKSYNYYQNQQQFNQTNRNFNAIQGNMELMVQKQKNNKQQYNQSKLQKEEFSQNNNGIGKFTNHSIRNSNVQSKIDTVTSQE